MNITDKIFHDEAEAAAHIERSRWPTGDITCPLCGADRVRRMGGKTQAGMFLCNDCRGKFTVRTGTVMERSHVPLHKWLLATHLLAASKKGMSAKQMERMLGVTYKPAWFLCHRIREAMDEANSGGKLGGPGVTVEADESWVGGLAKNRAFRDTAPKKIIMTLVERGGRARTFHIANVTGPVLRTVLVKNVDRASVLATDEHVSYKPLGVEYAAHLTINHRAKQYSSPDRRSHSNTAENFFSIFKRGVIGTYHHLSEAHLHRYCREFDLRYSTRDMTDGERAHAILKGMEGRRLTYRRTDALTA
ncbi:MAG: IS1595 family transposase [Sphingosinicella sp.]|uniref:IS1595 family transposase n=1 Tax=Sphingosinicella sp. TaxID=1917971 RepID=UPI00403844BE